MLRMARFFLSLIIIVALAKPLRNAKSTLYIIIERSLISMETMQNILTRRSVRKFADKPIEPDKLLSLIHI